MAFWSLILAITCLLGAYVWSTSYFLFDDYWHFALAEDKNFLEYLFTPIDVHYVPLHRLFTYLIYRLAPLNFALALLVLVIFHALTVVYLYRLLQLLNDRPYNRALILIYAANIYIMEPLMWWSAGIHRFPYILLSVGALYSYVQYRATDQRRFFLGALAAFVLALGFYEKGVLIPAYLLGVELCLSRWTDRSQLLGRLRGLCVFFLVSAAYAAWLGFYVKAKGSPLIHVDVTFLAEALLLILCVFFQGLVGVIYEPDAVFINVLVLAAWSVLFLCAVARSPSKVLVAATGLALLALNVGGLGLSGRWAGFSRAETAASVTRHYFELTFLAVIFLNLFLAKVPRPSLVSMLPERWRGLIGVKGLFLVGGVGYAALSLQAAREVVSSGADVAGWGRLSRVYVRNFVSGIRVVEKEFGGAVPFLRPTTPPSIPAFAGLPVRKILAIVGAEVSYDISQGRVFEATQEGRIREGEIREQIPLYKLKGGSRLSQDLDVDEDGCLRTLRRPWSSWTVILPEKRSLAEALIYVRYQVSEPHEVRLFYADDREGQFSGATMHRFRLLTGHSVMEFPVRRVPSGSALTIEKIRLDLRHSDAPVCIQEIRLVEYVMKSNE